MAREDGGLLLVQMGQGVWFNITADTTSSGFFFFFPQTFSGVMLLCTICPRVEEARAADQRLWSSGEDGTMSAEWPEVAWL